MPHRCPADPGTNSTCSCGLVCPVVSTAVFLRPTTASGLCQHIHAHAVNANRSTRIRQQRTCASSMHHRGGLSPANGIHTPHTATLEATAAVSGAFPATMHPQGGSAAVLDWQHTAHAQSSTQTQPILVLVGDWVPQNRQHGTGNGCVLQQMGSTCCAIACARTCT